tara:strand:- start:11 stop:1096 length:1086 start_codon:yes stop_codon:yes gene_type:complete
LWHSELLDLSIAHVDCDAFYASIEKRDDPSLLDKPVIIGGAKRGVVSTCCYIARMHGVHSAMPMFQALQACPDAIVIRPNMVKYQSVAREVRDLMLEITPLVEPVSIDEAYLDLTDILGKHSQSPALALIRLANQLESQLNISASIGLGPNKFLAKLASDLDKPRGFALIGNKEARDFIAPMPVKKIWGVGPALTRRLAEIGINKIQQLQTRSEDELVLRFGSIGHRLAQFANGEDSRSVGTRRIRKSLSSETTFEHDYDTAVELKQVLLELCRRVSKRMKVANVAGNSVVLKLKTSDFKLRTRTMSLAHPTQRASLLYEAGTTLLAKEVDDSTKFRLIGIGVTRLSNPTDADPPDMLPDS